MLRRSQLRAISSYEFGHPLMTEKFLPDSHFLKPANAVDQGIQVAKAPNGAKIVTHNKQGAQSSIGLYVQAGPKQDPAKAPGLSYVMRWALTGSNAANSIFQMDRTLRAVGAAIEHCEVEKKFLGWKLEAIADNWKKPAEDLFTCMAAPRFPEWDIERFRDTMDNLLQESRWQDPRGYCIDNLEVVAFEKAPLGNPRFVAPEYNDLCSHSALLNQWASICTPDRVVIAGINVDADELAATYEHCPFQHTESAPHHKDAKRDLITETNEAHQYYGGNSKFEYENRAKEMGTHPHMDLDTIAAVGFRTYGRETMKKYATSLVLRSLFNNNTADSIRTNRSDVHFGLRSFSRTFASTGLVGFTVRDRPENMVDGIQAGISIMKGLDTSEASIKAAATRAKAAFYTNHLELNRDYVDLLAVSLNPVNNTVTTPEEYLTAIDNVKPSDVKEAIEVAIKSRPTMFSTGSCYEIPSLKYFECDF